MYPYSSDKIYPDHKCSPYVCVYNKDGPFTYQSTEDLQHLDKVKIWNLNNTLYIPTFIIPDLSEVYFLVYDENNHPNDA